MGDYVSFVGFVDDETKFDVVSKSKLLILPSRYEALPVVLLEALGAGTPVVRYNLPLPRDLGGTIAAETFDLDEFTELVRILLTNDQAYDSLVQQITLPEEYNWDSIAHKTERLFEMICRIDSAPFQRPS